MNDRYFKKHQKALLSLANTEAGRFLLGINNDLKVVKLTPNSYHQLIGFKGKNPELVATFFLDDRVAQKIGIPFQKMQIAQSEYKPIPNVYDAFLHYSELETKYNRYPQIYLLTLTANPNTGERSGYRNGDATWATARGAASSTFDSATLEFRASVITGNFYINRNFQPFNTSSLTSNAVVSASNYQFYRDDTQEYGGNGFLNQDTTTANVVVSTQASATAYATTDFPLVSFTSKGSLAFASTNNGNYNTISISDQTIISTTSNTKLATLVGIDISNTQPAGLNNIAYQNKAQANPPKLTITYTLVTSGASFLLNFI